MSDAPKKLRKSGKKCFAKEHLQLGARLAKDTTKELLLQAGKKLFARKGLDGITVKDLATEAGVNVSLVSYYYQGKEGLYEACLLECGRESLALSQRLLTPPLSSEDFHLRLQLFIDEMYEFFSKNQDHVRTLLREIESEDSVFQRDYKEVFEETFLKVFITLVEFFRGAQKIGLIRKNLDPHLITVLFRGAMSQVVRTDFLSQRYYKMSLLEPKFREKTRNHLLEIFLQGILVETTSSGIVK